MKRNILLQILTIFIFLFLVYIPANADPCEDACYGQAEICGNAATAVYNECMNQYLAVFQYHLVLCVVYGIPPGTPPEQCYDYAMDLADEYAQECINDYYTALYSSNPEDNSCSYQLENCLSGCG